MSIHPFLDLRALNKPFLDGFKQDLDDCLADNQYILGQGVHEFEQAYASFIGVEYCVGVGNGTDALILILKALNIGFGDDVLVQAHTCDATWMAISAVGANPIPVDVDEFTLNINPSLLEVKITKNTKAVLAVHMNGSPADIDSINTFCNSNNLYFIEDNAQATGAFYNGKRTGSFGIAAAHSFYPTKPLGAIGDGGAITTNNFDLAYKIRSLANYGKPNDHQLVRLQGINSRLDDLQARFLLRKLLYVDDFILSRAMISNAYTEALKDFPIQFQTVLPQAKSANHLCTILTNDRDALKANLHQLGIETLVHYATTPHLLSCYSYTIADAPIASAIASRILSLPL